MRQGTFSQILKEGEDGLEASPLNSIMKALTVKQPWAFAIFHLGKPVENRDWDTPVRGRIAIHTSKLVRKSEFTISATAIAHIAAPGLVPPQDELPHGMIIGTVEVVDCVESMDSPWFFGDFGFVLRDPVLLPAPIPAVGALGFWDVPKEIEEQINVL